jgi:hypothetical protein
MKKHIIFGCYLFALGAIIATGNAQTDQERKIYSEDAVRHGEGVYTTKRYPEAERALQCAGFTTDFAPKRPSRNVVPGRDYEVIPHPAVKHAADVDLRPHVNGGGLCSYIKQQPQVYQWYQTNFGLSPAQGATPSVSTPQAAPVASTQTANAQNAAGSAEERKIYSEDAVRHGEGVYTTKRYPEAERALQCAGFTTDFAPKRPSRNVMPGRDYEVIPHPAVKHAADVDLRAHVDGGGLCNYIKQPQVHQWYMTSFGLSSPVTAAAPVTTQPAGPAMSTQPTNASNGATAQLYSDDAVRNAAGIYNTKRYPEAERALRCAGFTTNLAPTRSSRNVVPGKDYEIVPHPAVKHAADVDLRAHVDGGGLCTYIKQPEVHQWYKTNFGLSSPEAVVTAVTAQPIASISPQDINQLEAQMRKALEEARGRSGATASPAPSAQTMSNIDAELAAFIAAANSALNCSSSNAAFQQQNGAVIQKGTQMLRYAQQLQTNPTVRAQAGAALAPVLQAALPLARNLANACMNSSGTLPSAAAAGQSATADKYEQVAAVMKQVFSGGDLSPGSRAVRHAADVDMPARGGTPETLRTYLNSQNGVVKNWYKTNLGLSFQETAAAPVATLPAAPVTSAQATNARYEQVAAVMKQVFNSGDLSPNSRAVKYAADTDMPARGGTPETLHTYLDSQNGVVKNWYQTNFGLSFQQTAAAPVATLPAAPVTSAQATNARYEQVAAVMKQVFNGGDLSPNSRAVKYAADTDMPARGGTPETLHTYLNSQNGVVKNWYKTNFGLSFAELLPTLVGTVPTGSAESPQDIALNDAAMDLGKTREPLPALSETAALVGQARQFSDNLSQVVNAMKSGGGFDDAATAQLAGIVEAMRYLASGSPYSLQNLAGGGAVALNAEELQQVDALIAASGAVDNMRRMNTALLDAVREVQPQAVVWKEWPDSPRIQVAAMGELPLNLPAFSEFGRQTVNLSALDRVQRLVMVLKIANSLKTASAFSGGSLTLDTKINAVLDSIQQAMGIDPKKAGKAGAKQVMTPEKFREFMKASGKYLKVVSIAKLTTEWIQTLSQLAGWLMPDSIAGFYAQAGSGRTPSTWQIKKDATIGLSLYVVPQVSGGGNVLTPHGLVTKAVDAVKIPFMDRITGELGKRLEKSAKDYLMAFMQAQSRQLLAKINISSGPLLEWTISGNDTFPLPAKSLEPVEINDRRVANMSVVPAGAPQVVLDNPGNFTVLGKQSGNVTVRGYVFNPDLLRYFKTAAVLAMSVTVVEDAPPKPVPVAVADPTPKTNNKGQPVVVPAGPPHPLVGNEVYMSRGLWDCINDISVPLVPLPNPWIDPSIIGTNCAPK